MPRRWAEIFNSPELREVYGFHPACPGDGEHNVVGMIYDFSATYHHDLPECDYTSEIGDDSYTIDEAYAALQAYKSKRGT